MRKKRPLLLGIAIGVFARPIIVRVYRPFHSRLQDTLYNIAFDFIQNLDSERSAK
jgi:hypothetical protein